MDNEEKIFEVAVTAVLGVAILGMFALIGTMEHQDEVDDQAHYCEMVTTWKQEASRGIAARDRAGWPDYNNNYDEVCK